MKTEELKKLGLEQEIDSWRMVTRLKQPNMKGEVT